MDQLPKLEKAATPVSVEVTPCDGGVALALSEVLETKENGEIVEGQKLIAALSINQARNLMVTLAGLCDVASEPSTLTVLVITSKEAWQSPNQVMLTKAGPTPDGKHIQFGHAFSVPFGEQKKTIIEMPKKGKLILPGR